jgi:hypothetical protein
MQERYNAAPDAAQARAMDRIRRADRRYSERHQDRLHRLRRAIKAEVLHAAAAGWGQDNAWASFGRGYEGPRVTVATVYRLAKETGWIDRLGPLAGVRNEAALPAPKSGIDFGGYARTVDFVQLLKKKFPRRRKGRNCENGPRVCPGSMRYCEIIQAVASLRRK